MTRERILEALQVLTEAPQHTIQNPTTEMISKLAPHLEPQEVAGLLIDAGKPRASEVVFIGPPILIRGAEHVYRLRRWNCTIQLQWSGVYRRRESFYGTDRGVPAGWQFVDHEHRERVSTYSEVNYGDRLQWDESREIIVWHVIGETGSYGITGGYKREWTVMRELAEGRYPLIQVLDAQLCAATTHTAVSVEIQGGRMPMMSRNCGLCGGGIVGKTCTHCYNETWVSTPDWETPLHLSLLEATGQFDKFSTSPIHAIKVNYAKWAADGVRPFIKPVQHDRVITFPDEDQ
jgi:hypothetical protein